MVTLGGAGSHSTVHKTARASPGKLGRARALESCQINFMHRAETFFWSHPLDCSMSPLGTAHVQLAKGGIIRGIHGFRVNCHGSKNYKAEELRQKKRSHEDK
jgi:hypothetical protein